MIVLMDAKDKSESQNAKSETQPDQLVSQPPVISELYKIEDVENEQTDLPVVKFIDAVSVKKRNYRWLQYAFIALSVVQIVSIIIFFQMVNQLVRAAELGTAGTGAGTLFVFVVIVPLAIIVSGINLIGLPIYFVRQKARAAIWGLGAVSILISLIVFIFSIHIYLVNAVS